MPKGYNVKYVTFDCSKKVTTINIYLQQNIKIEHLERKKCQKMPNTHVNVEKGLGVFWFYIYRTFRTEKIPKVPEHFCECGKRVRHFVLFHI